MSAAEPVEHRVDARGLGVRVWEWPGAGPTVVLHHGFLDHGRTWERVARRLAPRHRVLALDARGHGGSDWVGAGGYYFFQDYVLDLEDVCSALASAEPVVSVGHSMGGMVASLHAATFPERVRALVSIEGAGPPDSRFDEAPARMREWVTGVRRVQRRGEHPMVTVEAAAERLRHVNPKLSPELALAHARHGTRPVEGGVAWSFDPLHRTRSPQPFYVAQARAFWAELRLPTLLVGGTESGFVWDPAERREDIAGARRAAIADAGHMVHHEQPEALAELLLAFLAGLDGGRG